MRRYHKLTIWWGIGGEFQECTVSGKEDLVRVYHMDTREVRHMSRQSFAAMLREARREPHTSIARYPDRGWS